MPKYTWECAGCRQIQIVDRKVADIEQGPEEPCPICESREYTRIIVPGGSFVLNGNGWFKKGGY
jgi:predicted nucleic acid-binding Zn ribbon protein